MPEMEWSNNNEQSVMAHKSDDSEECELYNGANETTDNVCDHAALPLSKYKAVYNQSFLKRLLKQYNLFKKDVTFLCRMLDESPLKKCHLGMLEKMKASVNAEGGVLNHQNDDSAADEWGQVTLPRIKCAAVYDRSTLKHLLRQFKVSEENINTVCQQLDKANLEKCHLKKIGKMLHPSPPSMKESKKQKSGPSGQSQPKSEQNVLPKPNQNALPSPQQNPKQEATPLTLYSNWDHFNKHAMKFAESQRALLSLCVKNLPLDRLNGLLELDLHHKRLNGSILQKVKEMATQLEGVHNKILSEMVALQTDKIQQLQDEIEKLKLEATEFPINADASDQSELADRLEAQMACIKDKDRRIAELLELLGNRPQVGTYLDRMSENILAADFDFKELSEEEVARLEPKALINHIRRELGVGTENLSAAQRRIFRAVRGKLGSALEKLAHDIYSNESQIVLEVIQNADDNYYDSGVEPHLSIKVCTEKYMWVTNNEVGFTNENVVAISDVGNSTKKDANRFTGHKGIGFKSVFKVTRTPYIISNDFHFRFNLDSEYTEENVGYILPEWVEKEDLETLILPEQIDPKMTHFYFPFSQSTTFPAEELYEGLDFIPLFLRQLHTIELTLDDKKKVVTVSKNLHKEPSTRLETLRLTVVEHTTSEDSGEVIQQTLREVGYRVYRKTLDVPKDLQVSQVGRAPPTKTELILAFPMLEDSQADLQAVEIQSVYSYLPVETAGFRFIIQADFHLVSSRDRVHTQDLFNRWLSWMVPVAFQEAFGLVEDPAARNSPLRDELFTFLPTKEELARAGQSESSTDGFWRRVMKGIRDRVMDTPCVFTEMGNWAKPNEVRIRPQGFEDLFTSDELWTVHSKEFVCKRMAVAAAYGLGCQYLSPAETVAILNHPEFDASKKESSWFYSLYRFFGSHLRGVGELLEQIFQARMFPLASGVVSTLQEGPIYLWKSTPAFQIGQQVLRLLALDFTTLDSSDVAYKFLEAAGISTATALDIANSILVHHFHLPKPVSESPASSSSTTAEQLWEQLRFLKENWLDVGQVFPQLETGLLVPVRCPKRMVVNETTDSPEKLCYYHYAKFVYMPSLHGAFRKMDKALATMVVFLDDSFLKTLDRQADMGEWDKFLTVKLGVNKCLRLCETYDKVYDPSNELAFALKAANASATLESPALWGLLLRHLQDGWDHLMYSGSLIRYIRYAKSGYHGFLISDLFPSLKKYHKLLLDSSGQPCAELPSIDGLVDKDLMADLGIPSKVTKNGLLKLEEWLKCPGKSGTAPVLDLYIWKKVYRKMRKHDVAPATLFIPTLGTFVKLHKVCLDLPSVFYDWVDMVQFPVTDYADAPEIKDWCKPYMMFRDLINVLIAINKSWFLEDTPNRKQHSDVLLECYWRMNQLMSTKKTRQAYVPLVLDRIYLLHGRKSASYLIMPDQPNLYQKFLLDSKCFCPVKFVHPELAKLPHVAEALVRGLNIPLLSSVVSVCPVTTTWYGYYVIPPSRTNIEVPTFLSSSLTNLYRALLAEFLLYSSRTLTDVEKASLGNLTRATTVYVCGVDHDKVPVAYTIYGVSRSHPENYYIHTTPDGLKQVIVPAGTLKRRLEDQVDLFAVRDLFPPLVIDNYLKTIIRRLIDGGLKHRLDPQYVLNVPDDPKTFNFEIVVEDTEVVQKTQEYRKSSVGSSSSGGGGASSAPRHVQYRIHHVAPRSQDSRHIPGLTFRRPPLSHQEQSTRDAVPTRVSRESNEEAGFRDRSETSFPPLSKLRSDAVAPPDERKITEQTFYNSSCGPKECFQQTGSGHPLKARAESKQDLGPTPVSGHACAPTAEPSVATASIAPTVTSAVGDKTNKVAEERRHQTGRGQPVDTRVDSKQDHDVVPVSIQGAVPTVKPSVTTPSVISSMASADTDKIDIVQEDKPVLDSSVLLENMKAKILSWSKGSVQEVEGRLFGSGGLQYNFGIQSSASSNTDLMMGVLRLEHEAEISKWIGLWAERIAYLHLLNLCLSQKPLLQGSRYVSHPPESFTADNWVSSARQHFTSEPCPCDDTKGYDFCYRQSNGAMVYVEVKGHAIHANTFIMSSNEWEVACRVANSTNEVYVILGVNLNVLSGSGAQIGYVLENPIELQDGGAIVRHPLNYLVEVVSPVAPHVALPERRDSESASSSIGTISRSSSAVSNTENETKQRKMARERKSRRAAKRTKN